MQANGLATCDRHSFIQLDPEKTRKSRRATGVLASLYMAEF
jgi:hypothetical protein